MDTDNDRPTLRDDNTLLYAMESNPTLKTYAGNFLLYGGVLAGHADGRFDTEEFTYLADALRPCFDQPETMIEAITSPEMAVSSLEETMDWLNKNGTHVRENLLACLAGIVAADHVLQQEELRFIQNVANGLGIPKEQGQQILSNAFGK